MTRFEDQFRMLKLQIQGVFFLPGSVITTKGFVVPVKAGTGSPLTLFPAKALIAT
jgi:hypothetical protein